ncbi:hypothetical protein OUZ56_031599 [Daphnia magna]|uniref:Uncharacterized protein n=1 Tax=Daphnia magna TaxID=35525 RepID=A0ABQ9ZUN6_9CRUS|nr:hypothetical protein OUZ56_031599 [Daphnia magna]
MVITCFFITLCFCGRNRVHVRLRPEQPPVQEPVKLLLMVPILSPPEAGLVNFKLQTNLSDCRIPLSAVAVFTGPEFSDIADRQRSRPSVTPHEPDIELKGLST